MDPNMVWPIVWIVTLVVFAVGLLVFRWWRKRQDEENDQWTTVWDLIELLIESVIKEAKQQLADIPLETVRGAAEAAYDKYIAGTPIAALVPKQFFINLVMTQWQRMLDMRMLAATTHQAVMAKLAASNLRPAAPPG